MAYATAPVEPTRRPAVVTAACWLLCLAAAAQVLSAAVTLSQLGATRQAYRSVFAGTPMKGAEDMFVAMTAASAVGFGLLLGVGYVVLAILAARGRNSARIVAWIVAGVSICFTAGSLALSSLGPGGIGASGSGNGAPTAQEIQQALTDAWPGWYPPLLDTIGVVRFAALVAAIILLALPAANRFFRKPEPAAAQPVPPPTA